MESEISIGSVHRFFGFQKLKTKNRTKLDWFRLLLPYTRILLKLEAVKIFMWWWPEFADMEHTNESGKWKAEGDVGGKKRR
ncbi:hypothetical protein MTR_3g006590 [Medicago truncatula]|uniref:Uncharacterized protein n=1 Tax=Medicago truncatula TaxID=3880 RepID=A0A072UT58_MEDTR|nr:hypothetical protein MTR_3g006590 [Medicago truncatula]